MRRYKFGLIGLTLAATAAGNAVAQVYPARAIRMIVPYPAGGGADFVARVYARSLAESLGQQVVVDNRGGANGNVGAEVAAKSPPDGYTLLLTSSTNLTVNPHLYRKMPFDVSRDFLPVSLVATQPNVLVVHPALPARSVKQLVALAKTRPGELNFASAGAGSSGHLSGELFMMVTGVRMVHVPYKGTGPATSDLLGGQIPLMFNNLPPSIPLVKAGKLHALAVTSEKRTPAMPDLPTMAEAGYPGVEVTIWNAVLVPAGTPAEIVARLNTEIAKASRAPELRERLAREGTEEAVSTPEQMTELTKAETVKWGKVVKAARIAPE